MANTTNFGWETPDDTDLVKDGAAAIRTLGNSIDTSLVDLKGGTTGQILSKTSNTDMDFTWVTSAGDIEGVTAGTGISGGGTSGTVTITNSMATAIDAKGDLVAGTGADAFARLAVGTNGQYLSADSAETTGLKWVSPASGGLTLITTETFSGSSAVNINNCFSSTYENYVIYSRFTMSSTQDGILRLRASGTNATGNDYTRIYFTKDGATNSGARSTSTEFPFTYGAGSQIIHLFSPQKASPTHFLVDGFSTYNTAFMNITYGLHDVSTAYDGISIYPGSGTITGTVRIYGLKD